MGRHHQNIDHHPRSVHNRPLTLHREGISVPANLGNIPEFLPVTFLTFAVRRAKAPTPRRGGIGGQRRSQLCPRRKEPAKRASTSILRGGGDSHLISIRGRHPTAKAPAHPVGERTPAESFPAGSSLGWPAHHDRGRHGSPRRAERADQGVVDQNGAGMPANLTGRRKLGRCRSRPGANGWCRGGSAVTVSRGVDPDRRARAGLCAPPGSLAPAEVFLSDHIERYSAPVLPERCKICRFKRGFREQ
jgi:hypothetical protein